jgi:hypothetical protein
MAIKGENINNLQNYSKNFINEIIEQLMKETDFTVIVNFLDAMKNIIKSTKLFLTTQEINNLTEKNFKNI